MRREVNVWVELTVKRSHYGTIMDVLVGRVLRRRPAPTRRGNFVRITLSVPDEWFDSPAVYVELPAMPPAVTATVE